MKVNSAMRFIVRIRVLVNCAAAVAVVGLACFVCVTMATVIGQTILQQTDGPAVPSMDLGTLMAAAR